MKRTFTRKILLGGQMKLVIEEFVIKLKRASNVDILHTGGKEGVNEGVAA